jgi:hypothetical protein
MANNPAQCPPRVKDIELPLATVRAEGTVAGPVTAYFQVRNPSVRLHCTLYVYARPSDNGNASGGQGVPNYTGETWQLYAQSDSTPEMNLNWVFDAAGVDTPRPLPDSYEFESGIKVIRGAVVLTGNGTAQMTYYVRAVWEPAAGGPLMSDAEKAELYALCELRTKTINLSC